MARRLAALPDSPTQGAAKCGFCAGLDRVFNGPKLPAGEQIGAKDGQGGADVARLGNEISHGIPVQLLRVLDGGFVLGLASGLSELIFTRAHGFQVVGVAAQRIPAQVVQVQAMTQFAATEPPSQPMDELRAVLQWQGHNSIPSQPMAPPHKTRRVE
jgi:hypothetical protein